MFVILTSFTPVIVAFGLKLTAVTLGAAALKRNCPDSLAAWLSSWLTFHVIMMVVVLALSAFGQVSALTMWGFLLFSCAGAAALYWHEQPATALWSGFRPIMALGALPFAVLFLFMGFRASFFQDFTWDAQTYGLVRLSLWMHNGSILVHMPTLQINLFTNEWNGELIALLYGLVSGNLQGLIFGGVEILLVTFLAAAWLAYRLGARPAWAALVGSVIATTPACIGLSSVVKGDMLAGTALLMGAGWLTVLRAHPLVAAAMFTASLALGFGSKITVAFGAAGLVIVALSHARKSFWPAVFQGAFIGLAMSAVILSRNFANLFIYGDPVKRIPGESAQLGIETFTKALDFVGTQAFSFYSTPSGTPLYGWLLSGGMGLTMYLACAALLLQLAIGSRPTPTRLALIGSAVIAIGMNAFITPTFSWSFRYYLPMMLVIATALIALPLSDLRPWARWLLVSGAVVAAVVNIPYAYYPGEINGNYAFADGMRTAMNSTPNERSLMAYPPVREAYGMDEFKYDRESPLTFVILNVPDRPLSPFVGSRAQNHLLLVPSIEQLTATTQEVRPDFAVITKDDPAPLPADYKDRVDGLGYELIRETKFAAIWKKVHP